jgi:hypothetical protein
VLALSGPTRSSLSESTLAIEPPPAPMGNIDHLMATADRSVSMMVGMSLRPRATSSWCRPSIDQSHP